MTIFFVELRFTRIGSVTKNGDLSDVLNLPYLMPSCCMYMHIVIELPFRTACSLFVAMVCYPSESCSLFLCSDPGTPTLSREISLLQLLGPHQST